MKVRPLIEHIDSNNFLQQYLEAKGVKDVDHYLIPTFSNFDDPCGYENITEAAELLNYAINHSAKVGIIQDVDADGVMSATIAYRFLVDHEISPTVFFHTGKQHGISISEDDNIFAQIIEEGINLLWIPDAGSQDKEYCRLLKERDIDIIVTDHHPYESNPYAVIVNTHNKGNNIKNYALTGAGVTYKLVQAYSMVYDKEYNFAKFVDLVAFSVVSDVADLTTLENRAFLYLAQIGLNNSMLREMLNKFGRKEGFTPHCISMYLAPKINAVCRSSDMEAKKALFNGFISDDEDIIGEAIKVASHAHTEQSNITKELYEELDEKIISTPEDGVVVTFGEEADKNYLGLAANKLVSQYRKPCIVLRELNPTTWTGSLRSPVDVASQINITKFAICRGHESACGIDIKKANLKKFIRWATSNLDIDPSFNVAGVLDIPDINLEICRDCEDWSQLWGISGGNILVEPTFYVETKIERENLFFCGKGRNSVKITQSDVDFWMFKCSDEELEELTQYPVFTLKMIVKLGVNSWEGKTNPKAIVENFEVEQYEESFEDIF